MPFRIKPTQPSGKVARKDNDPLPKLTSTLFGPFGRLDEDILAAIHTDEYWYGDDEPVWRDAPDATDAAHKGAAAAARLKHWRYCSIQGASELASILGSCCSGNRCGSHACPQCGRADQRCLVDMASRLIGNPSPGFQDFVFNLVMPEGQAPIPELDKVAFDEIIARCRVSLDQCEAVAFAILGIDISANDDSAKFLAGRLVHGPRKYWQVHVYGIVRTHDRQAIWDALRPLFKNAANIFRPLYVSGEPFDGSLNGVSYVCKPHGFRHTPYLDKNGCWNTPPKPPALTAYQHVQYLLAMHKLGFARRIALVGLHPILARTKKTKLPRVVLRRVFRGRSACKPSK